MTELADKYIAFEGIEGAGKSTVAREVARHLNDSGRDAIFVREPGGTEVGERVREILLGEGEAPAPLAEAALFAASRAQLIHTVVRPALEAGKWVITDRSAYSSLAYQAIGRDLGLEDVRRLNDIAIGGLWPGRVVLLKLTTGDGLARQAVDDRIGGEGTRFHESVADGFDSLAAAEPDRFVVVDASRPISVVVNDVIERLGL
ncbi:MAG: dTMP kinase [Acidimicrobiia bacterium]|nr:dTMP kinase [Acidimicrobiia bacterium]